MEKIFLVPLFIVLFCIPFIGWETGWQTSPPSFINIFIYVILFVMGVSMLFSHIQKKPPSDSKLMKISILIALLLSPLIVTVPAVFVAIDIVLPSGVVLPFALLYMLTASAQDISNTHFHYFIMPVITFLFIYSILWIVTRRYHLYPDRLAEWNRVFLEFIKFHKKIIVISKIVVLFSVVIVLYIFTQLWVIRDYQPIADDNTDVQKREISQLSSAKIKVPSSYPFSVSVFITCPDLGNPIISLLDKGEDYCKCSVFTTLSLKKESQLNFDFTSEKYELRDTKNRNYIYPYTIFSRSESIGVTDKYERIHGGGYTSKRLSPQLPPSRTLVIEYKFRIPPEQIELTLPSVQVNNEEYELSPIRFKYEELLNFGKPDE